MEKRCWEDPTVFDVGKGQVIYIGWDYWDSGFAAGGHTDCDLRTDDFNTILQAAIQMAQESAEASVWCADVPFVAGGGFAARKIMRPRGRAGPPGGDTKVVGSLVEVQQTVSRRQSVASIHGRKPPLDERRWIVDNP